MIFHLVLNSLLVFLVIALCVEFVLFLFQVKNSRLRYCCRSLPILKLPFDLVFFACFDESPFVNFNPFSCELYFQEFLMSILPIQFTAELNDGEHLIIPTFIASHLPSVILDVLIFFVITIASLICLHKGVTYTFSFIQLELFKKRAVPLNCQISNPTLLQRLQEAKAIILISNDIEMPCAVNTSTILFPTSLIDLFTKDEFEAVIAHELEHLRWRDPLYKLACTTICALFWWIPTRWWLRRLEVDQEQASDAAVYHYGIKSHRLAEALMKVIKTAKTYSINHAPVCALDSPKQSHVVRLKKLFEADDSPEGKHFFRWNHLIGALLCGLAFSCFWLC